MFRKRPHYGFSAFRPEERVDHVLESGKYIRKISIGTQVLPSVENFDLQSMIDAGLPLEKVSTVIKQTSFDASLLEPKTELKTEPETKE